MGGRAAGWVCVRELAFLAVCATASLKVFADALTLWRHLEDEGKGEDWRRVVRLFQHLARTKRGNECLHLVTFCFRRSILFPNREPQRQLSPASGPPSQRCSCTFFR